MRDTEIDHPEPVQLSRDLVTAAIRNAPSLPRSDQQARVARHGSAMKAFLLHARTVQNLPSFARRMRS